MLPQEAPKGNCSPYNSWRPTSNAFQLVKPRKTPTSSVNNTMPLNSHTREKELDNPLISPQA